MLDKVENTKSPFEKEQGIVRACPPLQHWMEGDFSEQIQNY
jgi:hypothetical protein